MSNKSISKSFTNTMIICLVLFLTFIFASDWIKDNDDLILIRACAGFVFGFAVDRVYMTIVHDEQEVRENEKSKYSYEYNNSTVT